MRPCSSTIPLLLGALLVGTSSEAQVRADLVFGTRIDAGTSQRGTATLSNGETRQIVLRQSLRIPWVVAGVRVSHPLYRSIGLELGYTAAWIKVTIDDLGGGDTPVLPTENGMTHTFALRPLVEVGRIGNASAGHVFAGPVMVWRTGEAFEEYRGTLRGGWSIGLGATLRTKRLHFRADLEDVIYPLELRRPGVITTDRRIHHNLSITVGIALLHGRIPPTELRRQPADYSASRMASTSSDFDILLRPWMSSSRARFSSSVLVRDSRPWRGFPVP